MNFWKYVCLCTWFPVFQDIYYDVPAHTTLSQSPPYSPTHSFSYLLIQTHSLTRSLKRSLTLSLSHTHTHMHTHVYKGFSILRFALLRIFVKMLGALSDRDKKIIAHKTVTKTQANEARYVYVSVLASICLCVRVCICL